MTINQAAVVLALGLFSLEQPAFGQKVCKDVMAQFVDVFISGNTSSGTITNGGILNGTTVTAFTSAAFPTPAPTIVSFSADLTITTDKGQLKTSNVYLYDFPSGLFTVLALINPNTSTGKFAGATGVLYISGSTIGSAPPFTYPSDITGEICSANL